MMLAAKQHADTVGEHAHHGEVVGDEQHRRCHARPAAGAAAARMLACTDTSSADRISSQSSSFGLGDERPRDGDALALAARQLVRHSARHICRFEPGHRRARVRCAPRFPGDDWPKKHPQRPRQRSCRRGARGLSEASGFWNTILDAAGAASGGAVPVRSGQRQRLARKLIVPAAGGNQPADRPRDRRLAAAGFADQREGLALADDRSSSRAAPRTAFPAATGRAARSGVRRRA